MKISVVLSTILKNKKWFLEAIESILQNNPYELIIVVKNKEQVIAVSNMFNHDKIKVFIQTEPYLNGARYTGWKRSSGNIVLFTDDDVVMKEDYLINLEGFFMNNPSIDGVSGKTIFDKESQKRYGVNNKGNIRVGKKCYALNGNSMAYRTEVLSKEIFMPFDIQPADDTLIGLNLIKNKKHNLMVIPDMEMIHHEGDWLTLVKRRVWYGKGKWKLLKWSLKNKVKLYPSLYSPILFITGFIFLLVGILLGSPFFVTIPILGNILVSYWLLSKYEILNYAKAYFYLNICHILMMFGFISEMFKEVKK